MAFSFSSVAASGGRFAEAVQPSKGIQVSDGAELQEILTDQLGFSAIDGDTKIRLLPKPWPADDLPAPTASLLTVASRKGLLAAAGPDTLILAQTSTVRNAFHESQASTDTVKPVQPEVNISVPRLSHIAFSSDENSIVASPEQGGGIAAYSVNQLTSGDSRPALELSTNNTSLRALIPNPALESAHLFAAVTVNGELLIADLKSERLTSGPDGAVLKSGVSCLSWSNKGKALVAGSGDGTATQLRADGTIMAEIPRSTSIPANMHMSAISWLENDTFFAVYTPNDIPGEDQIPPSEFWIITRTPQTSIYSFQKLPEVCGTWGMRRMPSFQYIIRLRSFPPHIQDLLVVAATTSNDFGLISKASQPLSTDAVAPGTYAFTVIGDDRRRPALPLSQSGPEDTSPIGVGLDLSSTEEVINPVPSDPEIQQSSTPLPNYLVLNNEGILSSWWIVYTDSIRQKTNYPGLVAASGIQQASIQSPAPSREVTPAHSVSTATGGFGSSNSGSSTPFAKPNTPAFGTSVASTGFGGSTGPAFGQSATFGGAKASWATTGFAGSSTAQTGGSGFGQPAFGSATPFRGGSATPAFGGPSALGSRPSTLGGAATPAFGQAGSLGGTAAASPFSASASKTSGFASFAGINNNNNSGFSAAKAGGEFPFAQSASSNGFGGTTEASPFTSKSGGPSAFEQAQSLSGLGSSDAFKIESSFKGDGTAKDDLPRPANAGGFGFGNSFDDMLGDATQVTSPTRDIEAEMRQDSDASSVSDISVKDDVSDVGEEEASRPVNDQGALVTPPSTIIQSKVTPAPPLSDLFGNSSQAQSTTPQAPPLSNAGFSFGAKPSNASAQTPSQKSKLDQQIPLSDTDQTSKPTTAEDDQAETPGESPEQAKGTPEIKPEPPSDDEGTGLKNIPEAPLPPDPTSKASYSIGGTSASSDRSRTIFDDDAPLPPDFIHPTSNQPNVEEPDGPEDDGELSSDFEGSGEDVTQDISPIDNASVENTEQIQMSPESSLGRNGDKSSEDSPTGGLFTKVTTGDQTLKSSRALFGEVGSGPVFAPPVKPQESPRSPSPVRKLTTNNLLRPDAARSVSAPSKPPSIIEQRRTHIGQSGLSGQVLSPRDSSATRVQAQAKVLADAQAKALAEAAELEDDEDERLRQELAQPVLPSQDLCPFVPFQQNYSESTSKAGIPGQIERLYQDINSMIDTLGINARSLSSFLLYQQDLEGSDSWPQILTSETPRDALNDEWVAGDIPRLQEGISLLEAELASRRLIDVTTKLQHCQTLLNRDLPHLRTISTALRRTLDNQVERDSKMDAPLSAEQASIQHDLRKAATNVQLKLSQAEEMLIVLRAKLAESAPKKENGLTRSASQRKPTVEAVTNTIAKMTAMAEAKSTEIDVLEARLKKMELISGQQQPTMSGSTPERLMSGLSLSNGYRTPGSSSGSVYHTPGSKFARSETSTPGLRSSMNGKGAVVSTEDRQAWKQKAARKQAVADTLRKVLVERSLGKANA